MGLASLEACILIQMLSLQSVSHTFFLDFKFICIYPLISHPGIYPQGYTYPLISLIALHSVTHGDLCPILWANRVMTYPDD